MTDTTDSPDALTVAEAAALGISRDGVLKRIKRKQLVAWQVRGVHGREWRVQVTPDVTTDRPTTDTIRTTPPTAPAAATTATTGGQERVLSALETLIEVQMAILDEQRAIRRLLEAVQAASVRPTLPTAAPDTPGEASAQRQTAPPGVAGVPAVPAPSLWARLRRWGR